MRVGVGRVDWIIEAFDGGRTSATGYPSGKPFFIVDVPRTGATLLERMIRSECRISFSTEVAKKNQDGDTKGAR